MALYFLAKSPTYVRRTEKGLFRRRQIVCEHLNDVYKAGKNKEKAIFDQASQELGAENIKISWPQFVNDKYILRTAYLWLISDENKKTIIMTKSVAAKGVIKYLKTDNINFWSDSRLDELPITQAEAEEQEVDPFLALRKKLASHQLAEKVLSSAYQLLADVEPLVEENEHCRAEIQNLLNLPKDNETYITLLEDEVEALTAQNNELKERLRHAHTVALEEIAVEHPEIPELFTIAQNLKQSPARWQAQFKNLIAKLAQTFTWQNDSGSMTFRHHFLGRLAKLQEHEQEQVIKQVHALSQDPERHSLDTRKNEAGLPLSPPGCMSSRGSDTWRFSWKKNGGIVIYALFRKSDTRLRQREA